MDGWTNDGPSLTIENLREMTRLIGSAAPPIPRMLPSPLCPEFATRREQYRFPRSKRRRIRKRWAAREVNWRTVIVGERLIYQTEFGLHMHPRTFEIICARMATP